MSTATDLEPRAYHQGAGPAALLLRAAWFPAYHRAVTDLAQHIATMADFPRPGILFRDIMPLLKTHLAATIAALDGLLSEQEWARIDAVDRGSGTLPAFRLHVESLVALLDLRLIPPLQWNGQRVRSALSFD